eukprot:262284-Pleurochrysis_carterae.AAC.3
MATVMRTAFALPALLRGPASVSRCSSIRIPAIMACTSAKVSDAPGETALFKGDVSDMYEQIFEVHRHKDGPWALIVDRACAALPSGSGRLLDLATGPGEPAKMLAEAMPRTTIYATDVSEDMLDKARSRMQGLSNVEYGIVDMQDMSQFPDASFDVVTACYGYMFPEDRQKAVSEAHRVLRPGGTLIATYWQEIAMLRMSNHIIEVVSGRPATKTASALVFSEHGSFDALLSNAGFVSIENTLQEYPFELSGDADFQFAASTMFLRDEIDELNAHSAARAAFDAISAECMTFDPAAGKAAWGPNRFVAAVAKKR